MKNFHFIYLFLLSTLIACHSSEEDQPMTANQVGFILEEEDLADYEKKLDHAGFINNWSEEFYHKGMVTYRTVCFNCHGNEETPGSMPNAMKFWEGEFKHGSDPYAIYETLTRGYGLMAPQVNLSPQEKYEVIHFIREEYIKEQNSEQYFEVNQEYIESLPIGDTLGPAPKKYQPWAEMDYGNFFIHTYDFADSTHGPRGISGGPSPLPDEDFRDVNFAYKGIAIRLDKGEGGVASGKAFALFDHDLLRFTGFWTGEGFMDYRGILLNDEHNVFPRTVGEIQVENPITPGWANPETGEFKDPRFVATDGRPFGPLPKEWAHYKGLYTHGQKLILKYSVGEANILESYNLEQEDTYAVIGRTLNIEAADQSLSMRILPAHFSVSKIGTGGKIEKEDGFHILRVAANESIKVKILMTSGKQEDLEKTLETRAAPEDLGKYIKGGPAQYTEQVLSTPIIKGEEENAYAVDVLTLPQTNPWNSRMRPSGVEFIKGGEEALICTIDGEVYRVEGITQEEGMLKWHRIATGLYQPLGIRYHEGKIYVGCRDQIVILNDLNGDGETDYYESFNSDHQVSEHYHEFAMGLSIDSDGNFYYAKSARHARNSLIPQHGTLIKVSPDGENSEIIAHGFRAANGVCLNPDGSFYVTDQEGHWNPMNRINHVKEGGFYGNIYGYGAPKDTSDEAMLHPMIWVDMKYDRSPAELIWAESDRWGPLNGALLNLSYGYGKIFVVMPQDIGGRQQGAIVELPVPEFPTGLMRARFNPKDGQFYGCGMSAWATSQMIQVGGFYRVRYTGKALNLPIKTTAFKNGIQLKFSDPLDTQSATSAANFTINTWDLKRTRRYGSKRYNTQTLKVDKITLSEDGKTLFLYLPDIQTTWVMEIIYDIKSVEGAVVKGAIQNSIYKLEEKAI